MIHQAENTIKILLVGDSQVGKSSLLNRYVDNTFTNDQTTTIGLDLKFKNYNFENDQICRIQFWDTAGQERFRSIHQNFYKGSHGIFIVFDLTNDESFRSVRKWYEEIQKSEAGPIVTLIGNKSDRLQERKVSFEDIKALTEELNVNYMETSAQSSENVSETFKMIINKAFYEKLKMVKKAVELTIPKSIVKASRGCFFWPF